jgi:hypothetical protein
LTNLFYKHQLALAVHEPEAPSQAPSLREGSQNVEPAESQEMLADIKNKLKEPKYYPGFNKAPLIVVDGPMQLKSWMVGCWLGALELI